jgi:hypothetical protein
MNDLIYSLTNDLDQAATPVCTTNYGERVSQVILSKAVIPAVGDVPTPEEIAQSFNDSGCTIIKGIANGHRIMLSDTYLEYFNERHDPRYRIEGRIRLLSESMARMCEKLTGYNRLYAYYITDRFYCFGPYRVEPDFTQVLINGKGDPTAINFQLDYFGGGIDNGNYDADYDNMLDYIQYTADMDTITVDTTLITADQI